MPIKPAQRISLLSEYYFSKKLREIQELRDQGHQVINLGIGSPDLSPADPVINSLVESAKNPRNHGYQPYNGNIFLRKAVSEWMSKTYNVQFLEQSEILPLMGSKEGIMHISLAYTNEGDKVLVPELGYPAYTSISKMLGLKVIYYPLNEQFYPDFENFTPEMKEAKIMWINYPHMPTGAKANKEVFRKVIDFGIESDILIAHDNPYSLVLNKEPLSIFSMKGSREVAVELHSLSKSHNMAGWRMGWICGNAEFIKNILTIKSNIDSGMFKGIEQAAATALQLEDQWHTERNEIYAQRQKLAFELLETLNCTYNSEQNGMFVWGKIKEGQTAEEFSNQILRDHYIFITPGSLFGEKGKEYIRISLCSVAEDYVNAINRVKGI
ncbi:MAG: aminotransferase class I/II-fold pyridoxal phosphate-dependent enzyme [Cyclobacteriaceae bacterium]|nr:aminotransferase class I/II-fold pyridoxal phosphate-dependent enzyme [Cyclobacteriaceae bacterium]